MRVFERSRGNRRPRGVISGRTLLRSRHVHALRRPRSRSNHRLQWRGEKVWKLFIFTISVPHDLDVPSASSGSRNGTSLSGCWCEGRTLERGRFPVHNSKGKSKSACNVSVRLTWSFWPFLSEVRTMNDVRFTGKHSRAEERGVRHCLFYIESGQNLMVRNS